MQKKSVASLYDETIGMPVGVVEGRGKKDRNQKEKCEQGSRSVKSQCAIQ